MYVNFKKIRKGFCYSQQICCANEILIDMNFEINDRKWLMNLDAYWYFSFLKQDGGIWFIKKHIKELLFYAYIKFVLNNKRI